LEGIEVTVTEQIKAACRRAATHSGVNTLPFGKWRGLPIGNVDTPYLLWFATSVKTSPGLARSIKAELQSRGTTVDLPAEPTEAPKCKQCGHADLAIAWRVFSNGT
jgi:hypothetical protein